jgi:hypothetical protein
MTGDREPSRLVKLTSGVAILQGDRRRLCVPHRPRQAERRDRSPSTEAALQPTNLGQNWERAALIKARPVAGDKRAGEAFLAELTPYLWRKYLDYAAIADIHSIKRQIHDHRGHGEVAVAGHNIKLGRGGIANRILRPDPVTDPGGVSPRCAVRARSTRRRADRARRHRRRRARRFGRGLDFLRTLNIACRRSRTSSTPCRNPPRLDNVARFGLRRDGCVRRRCNPIWRVQSHYARLFNRRRCRKTRAPGVHRRRQIGTIETLRKLGFSQPEAVSATIRGWHHGRIRATRSEKAREKLTALMPLLLHALGKTANPDIAFTRFDKFLSGLPSGVQVFALLFSNPGLLDLIAGSSAPRRALPIIWPRAPRCSTSDRHRFLRHQPDWLNSKRALPLARSTIARKTRRRAPLTGTVASAFNLRTEIDGIKAGHAFADVPKPRSPRCSTPLAETGEGDGRCAAAKWRYRQGRLGGADDGGL